MRHSRRKVVHFNVSSNPSAQWTAQQVVEAFPWETVPKYLMRNRDSIYGVFLRSRMKNMGIKEVISAPRSPWQNPFVERVIGSIRRECTDHVIVLNEAHLKNILCSYFEYYHNHRTHLSLEKDSPDSRPIKPRPAGKCKIIALPRMGGYIIDTSGKKRPKNINCYETIKRSLLICARNRSQSKSLP